MIRILGTEDQVDDLPLRHTQVCALLGSGNRANRKAALLPSRPLAVVLAERPSDVLVPGLANGTIHAYQWNDDERRAILDEARTQLDET